MKKKKKKVDATKFYFLSKRYQYALQLHLGLNGKKHTYAQVGKKLGVTRQRAWQIVQRAIKQMASS